MYVSHSRSSGGAIDDRPLPAARTARLATMMAAVRFIPLNIAPACRMRAFRVRFFATERTVWPSVCSLVTSPTAPLKPTCEATLVPSRRRPKSSCRSIAKPAGLEALRLLSSRIAPTRNRPFRNSTARSSTAGRWLSAKRERVRIGGPAVLGPEGSVRGRAGPVRVVRVPAGLAGRGREDLARRGSIRQARPNHRIARGILVPTRSHPVVRRQRSATSKNPAVRFP